jgi:hypothetical protein
MKDDFMIAFFDCADDIILPSQSDLAAKQKEDMRFTDTYKIFKVEDIKDVHTKN